MRPLICVRFQESAPLGMIEPVLDEAGVEWRYLDAWAEPIIPAVEDASGLIVLGGEMNADELEAYPYLKTVRALVRHAIDAGVPTLGVCLGAQVMARALGAEVRRAPARELGFHTVKATAAGMDDPVLGAFAPQTDVFQFHEDECDLPAGSELLFEGTDVRVQAFRVGANGYGVQFHFEVTPEIIAAWCDEVPDLEESWGMSRAEVLGQARTKLTDQQAVGRKAVSSFLDLVR